MWLCWYFLNQLLLIIKSQKLFQSSMIQQNYALSNKNRLLGYDALQDKHATFYFNGYGVKKHLKKLKKAIQRQPFHRGYKQYAQMLNNKLSQLQKSNDDIHRKTKPYIETLKQSSIQKLHKGNYLTGKYRNLIAADQDSHEKKANFSFQNLPNISKYKLASPKGLTNTIKCYTSKEKDNKSLSQMIKFATHEDDKGFAGNLIKERSNKSVQGYHKWANSENNDKHSKLLEVKHEDFMSFLKKRQEEIFRVTKTLVPKKPSLIKEEASVSDQS